MAFGKNENQTIRLTGLAQSDESALNLGLRQYMSVSYTHLRAHET
mgnify:CR=1 FL=1